MKLRNPFVVLALTFLLAAILLPSFKIRLVGSSSTTIIVPDDFSTIQGAINNANVGDTIFVRNGTYCEQLLVNKTLTLKGESANDTVLDGGLGGNVLSIIANNVTVSGFNIQANEGYGIILNGVGNQIFQNTIANTYYGILSQESSFNNISLNTFKNNFRSIFLYHCLNCSISQNTITGSADYGIRLDSGSEYNTISDNNVTFNLSPSPDEGNGIWLFGSSLNIVSNNLVASNVYGIRLDGSTYNNVLGNTILNNQYYGIWLLWAYGNSILHNNFVNNGIQAYSQGNVLNDWNNTCEGNYWSDYTGVDEFSGPYQNLTGSDGIGDTPYTIYTYIGPNNPDNYPLMNPYPAHDIALASLSSAPTVVCQGHECLLTVKVTNKGNFAETFNVTVYANLTDSGDVTAIRTFENVTLNNHNSTVLTSMWDTTGFDLGNYTISAYATRIQGEISTADNVFLDGTVEIIQGSTGIGGGRMPYMN